MDARTWQVDAYLMGRDARFFLIQAPGGSGKSALQCMLAAHDLGAGQKQLICVPQTAIAKTFCQGKEVEYAVAGETLQWKADFNFCTGTKAQRGRRLKKFLLSNEPRAAICTHQGLVTLWRKLSDWEKAQAIDRTTFRLDEAHHIAGVYDEGDLYDYPPQQRKAILELATRLGEFCRYLITATNTTSKLHLSTATFYRGDRQAILSETVRGSFVQYDLDWEHYFPTLGIKELRFHYFDYRDSPVAALVEQIRREPNERHLVIIPPTGKKYRTTGSLPELLTALRAVCPERQLLDLVTPRTQDANKARLMANQVGFRVVVACRLFNEGTDWPACSRLHNTDSCERSLTLAVQRVFRPLRKYAGKKVVHINNYVPVIDGQTREARREAFSDRFNAVLVSVITHGEIFPICVPKVGTKGNTARKQSLRQLYGPAYQDLVEHVVKQYEGIKDKQSPKNVEALVEQVIEEYGVPTQTTQEEVKAGLQTLVLRVANPAATRTITDRSLVPGFDVAEIKQYGFDKVWERARKDSVLFYQSENVNPVLMGELLRLLGNPLTIEEIRDGVTAYHTRTGKRPGFYDRIDELKITAQTLAVRLKRLGWKSGWKGFLDDTLGQEHPTYTDKELEAGLKQYIARTGKRPNSKFDFIDELGLAAKTLDMRLRHRGVSLGQFVDRILGVPRGLTLDQVRKALKRFEKRTGQRVTVRTGLIPELNLHSGTLNSRLRTQFGTSLAQLSKYGPPK